MRQVLLKVNGKEYQVEVSPSAPLTRVLREQLGCVEVKNGCGKGECGSCTVLLNGRPIVSCLLPVENAEGKEITTVRGLAKEGKLHPLQRKFIEHEAIQCGYCTPGVLMSAKALLDSNPHPSESEIREAISGNLCRCTGYQQIVEAIADAAAEMASTPVSTEIK